MTVVSPKDAARLKVADLVRKFRRNEADYLRPVYNETQRVQRSALAFLRSVAAAAVVLAAGCSAPFDPGAPVRRVRAPAGVQTWAAELEACTGRSVRLWGIEWYVLEEAPVHNGVRWAGAWSPGRIGILERFFDHAPTVKHELLHELLHQHGLQTAADPHPAPWFNECVGA